MSKKKTNKTMRRAGLEFGKKGDWLKEYHDYDKFHHVEKSIVFPAALGGKNKLSQRRTIVFYSANPKRY